MIPALRRQKSSCCFGDILFFWLRCPVCRGEGKPLCVLVHRLVVETNLGDVTVCGCAFHHIVEQRRNLPLFILPATA